MEDIILRNREAIDKIANRVTFRNRNGSFYARKIKTSHFNRFKLVSPIEGHSGHSELWLENSNKVVAAFIVLGRLPGEFYPALVDDCTNGDEIYVVFSYQTPIGWARDNKEMTIPEMEYSITTTKHQSFTRQGEYAFNRKKDAM